MINRVSVFAPVCASVACRRAHVIIHAKHCHSQEHDVGLSELLVSGSIDDKIEAALNPEEGGEDQKDVGIVIDILAHFAHDGLVNYHGHVTNEVAHANSANCLCHTLVSC